jgi:hypothetical protein
MSASNGTRFWTPFHEEIDVEEEPHGVWLSISFTKGEVIVPAVTLMTGINNVEIRCISTLVSVSGKMCKVRFTIHTHRPNPIKAPKR